MLLERASSLGPVLDQTERGLLGQLHASVALSRREVGESVRAMGGTVQVTDSCGMLEAYAEVAAPRDITQAPSNPPPPEESA